MAFLALLNWDTSCPSWMWLCVECESQCEVTLPCSSYTDTHFCGRDLYLNGSALIGGMFSGKGKAGTSMKESESPLRSCGEACCLSFPMLISWMAIEASLQIAKKAMRMCHSCSFQSCSHYYIMLEEHQSMHKQVKLPKLLYFVSSFYLVSSRCKRNNSLPFYSNVM